MKNFLWRLSKLPTPLEVVDLVNAKIITHDEAKKILFKEETQDDLENENLKSEIKFLRELVDRLSKSPQTIIETIKYVEKPYYRDPWFKPYATWTTRLETVTSNNSFSLAGQQTSGITNTYAAGSSIVTTPSGKFSDIKTF